LERDEVDSGIDRSKLRKVGLRCEELREKVVWFRSIHFRILIVPSKLDGVLPELLCDIRSDRNIFLVEREWIVARAKGNLAKIAEQAATIVSVESVEEIVWNA